MNEDASPMMKTADIVSAFVGNNTVRASEIPELIAVVYASLRDLGSPEPSEVAAPSPTPAVSVRKSVTNDYIVCLEDGKKFKSMRRHLKVAYGMTPDDYRAKWGLPRDYPMVAPSYAAQRSAMAKQTGLGNRRLPAPETAAATPAPIAEAPPDTVPARRRGRPKKIA